MRTAAPAALALLVVLAGCTFAIGQSSGPVPPTTERCLTDKVPDPDEIGQVGNVTAHRYPAAPSVANATAVEQFVVAFEKAHVTNWMLTLFRNTSGGDADLERFDVLVTNSSVEQRSGRYVVAVEVSYGTTEASGNLAAEYVVDEQTMRRTSPRQFNRPMTGILATCG